MHKLLSDLNVSSALQALLTVIIWGSVCYLYVTGKTVPDTLLSAGSIILGYYFHTAAQQALRIKG